MGKFFFWELNASKLLIPQNNAEYCISFLLHYGHPIWAYLFMGKPGKRSLF